MKKLFVFSSWDSSFFREQARLVTQEFEVEMLVFMPKSIREFFKYKNLIQFQHRISEEGMSVTSVSYLSFWFLPYFIQEMIENYYFKKLNARLNVDKNAIIHVNTIYEAGFWANQFHKKTGVPYIIHEQQKFILSYRTKRSMNLIHEVIRNAHKMLVSSHDQARQLLTHGYQFEFEILGNYVDERLFFPIDKPESDVFKIITIGAFTYFKDQKTIFKTLKVLDGIAFDKKIEFHYFGINGWGVNHTETVKKLVQEFDYQNVEVFLYPENHSRASIAQKFQEADMFILSSLMEGMCVSLMEALGSGLPVCTTQCGGVDELIDEENGKVFQIRDFQSMAAFIEKIIKKDIVYDRKRIAEKLIDGFGNVAYKAKLLHYYLDMIK
ncbi:glycosyltransferase family 4 protein [Flavobacterium branchiophilum]|uniref:Glycosyl transferase, group 1 family protein n=1 Tax=Flavobacterium branchiophilum (strain FL-15) TaxID=1034807 RepID=G2Z6N2_FLABF|nr:glycosyltransferase family 4 protein [Flavobacterium branchiophilum]CCB68874.1 Glycosyl transferase, group 1 family protein [Flavobacterium branchiophilum FL-15]